MKKGDLFGVWNDFWFILWNFESGFLKFDVMGCGIYFGGLVEMNGDFILRFVWGEGWFCCGVMDGYFYVNVENVGFYLVMKGLF